MTYAEDMIIRITRRAADGDEVAAFVIARKGTAPDLDEFCRGRIAHFKVPRYVITVAEFPMTVTGKIQKFKLRERGIDDLGLQTAMVDTA